MAGGRAGTGVAAMEGGVLVPAHTKGFNLQMRPSAVSPRKDTTTKTNWAARLFLSNFFLLFICYFRVDFIFFLISGL